MTPSKLLEKMKWQFETQNGGMSMQRIANCFFGGDRKAAEKVVRKLAREYKLTYFRCTGIWAAV